TAYQSMKGMGQISIICPKSWIYLIASRERLGTVDASQGNTFDNQLWSNLDWMVIVVEEGILDVFIQQMSTSRSWWQMIDSEDCNRPDLSLDVTREK
ncbi:MAG: hypothetical protein KJ846_02980, partial [Proteobacteria bacterium]|nr:hypothetical protein [Pseudomonadota bacterium]